MANIKFYLNFTVSKLTALLILLMSFILELVKGDSSFEIALPVVMIMITGKQVIDYKQSMQIQK